MEAGNDRWGWTNVYEMVEGMWVWFCKNVFWICEEYNNDVISESVAQW